MYMNHPPPDIVFDGTKVDINDLDISIIHLLARRAPTIIYGISDIKRSELRDSLQRKRYAGSTNLLLERLLKKKDIIPTNTLAIRVEIDLVDLI